MAIPGVSDWQNQILSGVQAPITAANLRALNAWQQAEGGTYANNPFNTTLQTPQQVGAANSAGVRGYATPQAGIQATIDTLQNGNYGGILSALRAGNNPTAVAQAIANSPWGTGSGVLRVLGSPASSTPSSLPSPSPSLSPLPQTSGPSISSPSLSSPLGSPSLAMGVLGGLQSGNLIGGIMSGLMSGGMKPVASSLPKAGAPASVPLGGAPAGGPQPKLGSVKTGDPIPLKYQTSIGGEHATEGLDGFPAHDFFANAGSPVAAPVSGTIVKLSGHDPSEGPTEGPHGPFGWSVYVQGDNGRTYYLTHMGTRDVKVGQTIKAGQLLGTVGNYSKYGTPSHIHMGVSAPGVTVA